MQRLPDSPPSWLSRGVTLLARARLALDLEPPHTDFNTVVIYSDQSAIYDATYLRGVVSNFGLEDARECAVYLEQLTLGGDLVDDVRSPLTWTDESDGARFDPIKLGRGRKRRRYFDLCKVDTRTRMLQFLTKRSEAGSHTFAESGRFHVRIVAEAAYMASAAWVEADVDFDFEACDFELRNAVSRSRAWRIF